MKYKTKIKCFFQPYDLNLFWWLKTWDTGNEYIFPCLPVVDVAVIVIVWHDWCHWCHWCHCHHLPSWALPLWTLPLMLMSLSSFGIIIIVCHWWTLPSLLGTVIPPVPPSKQFCQYNSTGKLVGTIAVVLLCRLWVCWEKGALKAQKCHSCHHSFSPNFLVFGKTYFVGGKVKSQFLSLKINRNIANFWKTN